MHANVPVCKDFFCISVDIRLVRPERHGVGLNRHLSGKMNHGASSLLPKRCNTKFTVLKGGLREGEKSDAHYQS